jgi:serine/threonine protein kinase
VQVGDVIADRFELRSLAGEGGMGVVYRAFDRLRAGEVAFKTMRRAGPHETRRFAREVQVLRGLSHPGIVRHVADGVSDAGEPWLAME